MYDTALMQPDLQCDYEGTELEQFFSGLADQSYVIDSVYVEYSRLDSLLEWMPGCPNPGWVTSLLERSYTISSISVQDDPGAQINIFVGGGHLGFARSVWFMYHYGEYELRLYDEEMIEFFGGLGWAYYDSYLPFPEEWELNENGIFLQDEDWFDFYWPGQCQHFRLIFWHEAE